MKKKILLGILAATILVGAVGAVVVYNLGFRQRAEVAATTMIRVFYEEAQTNELTQGETYDWGLVSSGVFTMDLYVNNTGNSAVVLGFNYNQNQFPQGWTEYWDYNGAALAQNELKKVTITLVIPQYISPGVWEWDSTITAMPA